MLSINIPVYNIRIYKLTTQITKQAKKLNIAYEIRIYDDGSKKAVKMQNRKAAKLPHVVYKENPKNLGRSAIRNKMGFDSEYEYLLFIDADSKLISPNYISNFLRYTAVGDVVCGGTSYSRKKPEDPKKMLRWTYGTHREAIPAQQKNRAKGFIITSNNFLIKKSLFEKIHFREDLKGYGHEDTLLGYDLFNSGIKIIHIDNPVEHTGLENSRLFLEKTKRAIENLHLISEQLKISDEQFISQVTLLNKYRQLTRILPDSYLSYFYRKFSGTIEKNLTGKKPGLFLFDLYKLGYFATIKNRRP